MTKMSDRHKLMAYILHKEFGYKQRKIAQLMDVSQSTIASSIKEVTFRVTIQNLEKELQEARYLLQENGIQPELPVLHWDG